MGNQTWEDTNLTAHLFVYVHDLLDDGYNDEMARGYIESSLELFEEWGQTDKIANVWRCLLDILPSEWDNQHIDSLFTLIESKAKGGA